MTWENMVQYTQYIVNQKIWKPTVLIRALSEDRNYTLIGINI